MVTARQLPGYGRGEHTIDTDECEEFGSDALLHELRTVFQDKRYKPPVLPAAAHEIVALSKRARVSFEDVQRVVERDATIAGKVLQVAQSPIYASRVKPRTLRDAVQRLGLNNIRDIVWQVALDLRVFRAPGFDGIMGALQQHSVATAHIARTVCGYSAVANEYAFLCGLLHDVGLGSLLVALTEKHGRKTPPLSALWEGLRGAHAEASAFMAELWKLDPDLKLIVGSHHDLGKEPVAHPLVAVLALAEFLAMEVGFVIELDDAHPTFESVGEDLVMKALSVLDINAGQLETIRDEVADVAERMA